MTRAPLQVVAARAALTIGSAAGLVWLAPLEYGTGCWLGLHPAQALAVPALVDSYVVLSVLTARDRRWSLPIAGVSGLVGQLHAAEVLPGGDPAVRGWVAALAALVAVAVTARLKPLVAEVVAAVRTEHEAAETAREAARLAAAEAARRAARDAEEDAHRRALEADRAAHEQRLAEAAHAADLAARATPREPARAPRTTPARPRTGRTPKAPARAAHTDSDLQRRAAARATYETSVRAGKPLENAALAALLYGVTDPDQRQIRAASARASEWRRALAEDGGTDAGETDPEEAAR